MACLNWLAVVGSTLVAKIRIEVVFEERFRLNFFDVVAKTLREWHYRHRDNMYRQRGNGY